ncbi:MAG: hypothetical protein ACK4YV_12015 [Emticicia sp.]
MKNKNLLLGLTATFLFYIVFELLARLTLVFLGFSFFNPKNFIIKNYYPELEKVLSTEIKTDDKFTDILILGGSVISSSWSQMDERLDSLLPNNQDIRVFNVAIPSHTSLDNLIKYKLLANKKFDLVIYYEAINENRANNVAPQLFKTDYSHIEWYYHINILMKHPEINYTALPFLLHKSVATIIQKITHYTFIEMDNVSKENRIYGSDIKTVMPYRANLENIISLSKHKSEKLLLVAYASFFPKVKFKGDPSDAQYFAKNCKKAAIVTVWGDTKNTQKGIIAHNEILTDLANKNNTFYLDMTQTIPQDTAYFCDICHLSEKGCNLFAQTLSKYMINKKLLTKK